LAGKRPMLTKLADLDLDGSIVRNRQLPAERSV